MMVRWRRPLAGVGAFMLLISGCDSMRGMAGTLASLQAVQGAVAREVGDNNVQVNVNNDRYMTIGIINSPLRSLPDDERRAKALQIAQLAYKTYSSRASLETVGVVFVVHRSYFLFFNVNDGRDYFGFSTAELAAPPERGTELLMRKHGPPNDKMQLTAPARMERRS
jgi:hypothetical protein